MKPVIFGCSGLTLTTQEKDFFTEHQPHGFILFKRNIEDPTQVKNLISELKACVKHDAKFLIDQEGGRVARLKPPHWDEHEPCGSFENCDNPEQEAYNSALNIAKELSELGFNLNCAPMIDVRAPDSDNIIGDRAFSDDPKIVAKLGHAFINGLNAGNVDACTKHAPGHGRSKVDSHFGLPVVEASLKELREVDFYPFKILNDTPYTMTAHIIYTAIDPDNCATMSKKVIDIIRNEIGFKGLIMTDDLSMKALSGSFTERAQKSLAAGCDLILHCNGVMAEMLEIISALPK